MPRTDSPFMERHMSEQEAARFETTIIKSGGLSTTNYVVPPAMRIEGGRSSPGRDAEHFVYLPAQLPSYLSPSRVTPDAGRIFNAEVSDRQGYLQSLTRTRDQMQGGGAPNTQYQQSQQPQLHFGSPNKIDGFQMTKTGSPLAHNPELLEKRAKQEAYARELNMAAQQQPIPASRQPFQHRPLSPSFEVQNVLTGTGSSSFDAATPEEKRAMQQEYRRQLEAATRIPPITPTRVGAQKPRLQTPPSELSSVLTGHGTLELSSEERRRMKLDYARQIAEASQLKALPESRKPAARSSRPQSPDMSQSFLSVLGNPELERRILEDKLRRNEMTFGAGHVAQHNTLHTGGSESINGDSRSNEKSKGKELSIQEDNILAAIGSHEVEAANRRREQQQLYFKQVAEAAALPAIAAKRSPLYLKEKSRFAVPDNPFASASAVDTVDDYSQSGISQIGLSPMSLNGGIEHSDPMAEEMALRKRLAQMEFNRLIDESKRQAPIPKDRAPIQPRRPTSPEPGIEQQGAAARMALGMTRATDPSTDVEQRRLLQKQYAQSLQQDQFANPIPTERVALRQYSPSPPVGTSLSLRQTGSAQPPPHQLQPQERHYGQPPGESDLLLTPRSYAKRHLTTSMFYEGQDPDLSYAPAAAHLTELQPPQHQQQQRYSNALPLSPRVGNVRLDQGTSVDWSHIDAHRSAQQRLQNGDVRSHLAQGLADAQGRGMVIQEPEPLTVTMLQYPSHVYADSAASRSYARRGASSGGGSSFVVGQGGQTGFDSRGGGVATLAQGRSPRMNPAVPLSSAGREFTSPLRYGNQLAPAGNAAAFPPSSVTTRAPQQAGFPLLR